MLFSWFSHTFVNFLEVSKKGRTDTVFFSFCCQIYSLLLVCMSLETEREKEKKRSLIEFLSVVACVDRIFLSYFHPVLICFRMA